LQGHLGNSFTPNPPDKRNKEPADLMAQVVVVGEGQGIDLSSNGAGFRAGSLSPT